MGAASDAVNDLNGNYRSPWPQRIWKLREARGGRCQWPAGCDVTMNLEFAHIKATGLNGRGRGQTQRYRDIQESPDAYLLLCRPHHKAQEKLLKEAGINVKKRVGGKLPF